MKSRLLESIICSTMLMVSLTAAHADTPAPADSTQNQPAVSDQNHSANAESQNDKKSDSKHKYVVGPQVSVYFPNDKTARNRFGNNWLAIGVGIGHVNTPRNCSFDVGVNVIGSRKDKNRVTMVPVTLVYRMVNDANKKTVPYMKLFSGVYPVEMRSDQDNIQAGYRVGWGGGVSAGIIFDQRSFIDVSYDAVTKIRGIDLSGLNVTVGCRF